MLSRLYFYIQTELSYSLSADVRKYKVKGSDTLLTTEVIVVVTSLQIDDVRLIFNIFVSQEQFIYTVNYYGTFSIYLRRVTRVNYILVLIIIIRHMLPKDSKITYDMTCYRL